jgi:hypothetical protein
MSVHTTDDTLAQARRAIEYIVRLELAPDRWARITLTLQAAADAATAGDLAALAAATEELMLAGPVRIIKPDGSDHVPAGPPVHERANRALDALSAMQAVSARDRGEGQDKDGR